VNVLQLEQAGAAPWGTPLLEDISLTLAPGEILGLAGPNGAGKTSLLQVMAGDLPLNSGKLLLGGRPPGDWPRRQLARQLAYLPQLSLLNFPYTVEEVVALGRTPHDTGAATDNDILEQVMAATDIAALRQRLYTQLSGGEKQRVQLARVFAQIWDAGASGGSLLLLDEPTTALDLSHQQLVLAAVRQLAARGCAVVLVIHDLNLIAGLADRLAVLRQGRLVARGTPAEVFTPELFREVFEVEVLIQPHPGREQPLVINR
jgi:heme transport system ATP-binding protein